MDGSPKRRWIAAAIGVAFVAATILGRRYFKNHPFVQITTWFQVVSQATPTGRTIATLVAFRGRIYAGYGDYGANTGPISICGFDPASAQFDHAFDSATEA